MREELDKIVISGMTRVKSPKPNRGGSTVLAYFDCEVRGFVLRGAVFVRTSRGGLAVWAPMIENSNNRPVSTLREVKISDCELRHRIMLEAQALYKQMGGTDAEWIPVYNGDHLPPLSDPTPDPALPEGVRQMLDQQLGAKE